MLKIRGKEMAPCIVAKVRLALYHPNRKKGNSKKCSQDYWNQIVDAFAANDPQLTGAKIRVAKNRTDLFR